jgi:hypothetical protein
MVARWPRSSRFRTLPPRAGRRSIHTIHAIHAIHAHALARRRARIMCVGRTRNVLEKTPKYFSLARIDAIERIPRTTGEFHLDDHNRYSIGSEHHEVRFIAGVSRTSPVSRERSIPKRSQKSFGGALSGVPRTKVGEQAIHSWLHALKCQPDEVENRDPDPVLREM